MKIDLSLLEVISGPGIDHHEENEIKWFNYVVNNMVESYTEAWDMPPFIVGYKNGRFKLNDGTHRHAALKQLGKKDYYAFIWMEGQDDYEELIKELSKSRNVYESLA